jgi:Ni/Co efflux regulator RcnB
MRRLLCAVAAIALALPAASYAQERDHDRGAARQHAAQAREARRGEALQQRRATTQARPEVRGFSGRQNFAAEQQRNFAARQNVAPRANAPVQRFAQERERPNVERGQNFDRGRTFGGERNYGGQRYYNGGQRDYGGRYYGGRQFAFEGQFRGPVRMGAFRYPRGYGYRHWDRGEYLPSIFLSAPFFIDWNILGLPPPPPDYRWVRYGPDALLVDVYSGEVVDVIYGAFY